MALIEILAPVERRHPKKHEPVEAGFQIFEVGGQTYLQIVTYGTSERQIKGVVSQTIQFGPDGIAALRDVLKTLP
ncbi:hypothetical protein [Pseudorhodobacter sp.]|uniref:hypothetical protein n=1 Tax=Pseudorhodobacter sp. TaxID=1934400 RepID=UPI0026492DCB|nr:hypothetical protein [Pseudorhodobacter sp.]MDN5786046.1 hypothetical protein [Pseudorhodobacter sp.]